MWYELKYSLDSAFLFIKLFQFAMRVKNEIFVNNVQYNLFQLHVQIFHQHGENKIALTDSNFFPLAPKLFFREACYKNSQLFQGS